MRKHRPVFERQPSFVLRFWCRLTGGHSWGYWQTSETPEQWILSKRHCYRCGRTEALRVREASLGA